MTDFTQRTIDTVEYTARTLDTSSYSARGAIGTSFIGTATGTETGGDTTAPVITNFRAIDITRSGARFAWDTDEEANCMMHYGTETIPYSEGAKHAHYVKTGRDYELTGLAEATDYYIRAVSADIYGNQGGSDWYIFRTAGTDTIGVAPTIVA